MGQIVLSLLLPFLLSIGSASDFKKVNANLSTVPNDEQTKYRYFPALEMRHSSSQNETLLVWLNTQKGCSSIVETFDELPIGKTIDDSFINWIKSRNLLIFDVEESTPKGLFHVFSQLFKTHPEALKYDIFLMTHGSETNLALELTSLILEEENFKLKGLILLNPPVSPRNQFNLLVNAGYIKGITSKSDFDALKSNCDLCSTSLNCDYFGADSNSTCKQLALEICDKIMGIGFESRENCVDWRSEIEKAKRFYEKNDGIEEILLKILKNPRFLKQNSKILFAYGDLDTLYNHIGATVFFEKFSQKHFQQEEMVIKEGDLTVYDFLDSKPWYFSFDAREFCPTVGGFVKSFAGGIDFATIKGAGHFPHLNKPAQTLQLLKNFMDGVDFSTDLSDIDLGFLLDLKKKGEESDVFKRSLNKTDQQESPFKSTENSGNKLNNEISSLPGLETAPNFRQFSGYLQGIETHRIFYWLVESENNPSKAPLILWLNGGPGASSLNGLFKENGPFQVNIDGKSLRENQHSWNKFANVLYLESPVGVGYSYSEHSNEDFQWNDDNTADENYAALLDFINNVFPQYQGRDFYTTGESYGGVYLPMLAVRLINGSKSGEFKANFKGMAIGNGVFDYASIRADTLFHLLYYNGFTTYKNYRNLIKHCCKGNEIGCKFSNHIKWSNLGFPKPLGKVDSCFQMISKVFYEDFMNSKISKCSPYEDCLFTSSHLEKFNHPDIPYSCYAKKALKSYLRRNDVREALKIQNVAPPWQFYEKPSPICKATPPLFMFRPWQHQVIPRNQILAKYRREYWNMEEIIGKLFESGIRILFYNGDTDLQANHLGAQWFAETMAKRYGLKMMLPRIEWYFENDSRRIAGFQTKYGNQFDVLTVKGAGHMVPLEKPKELLQMIYNWVNGLDYSARYRKID